MQFQTLAEKKNEFAI